MTRILAVGVVAVDRALGDDDVVRLGDVAVRQAVVVVVVGSDGDAVLRARSRT
jgi:hypothetical protein